MPKHRLEGSLHCPFCGHDENKITDSRPTKIIMLDGTSGRAIRRRRQCMNKKCKCRFTTLETYYNQVVQTKSD